MERGIPGPHRFPCGIVYLTGGEEGLRVIDAHLGDVDEQPALIVYGDCLPWIKTLPMYQGLAGALSLPEVVALSHGKLIEQEKWQLLTNSNGHC